MLRAIEWRDTLLQFRADRRWRCHRIGWHSLGNAGSRRNVASCSRLLPLCCWFCCQFSQLKLLTINTVASVASFQTSYANFSAVYADSNNRQLLTNLAREQQDEPVYFIQLASISSEYQFNSSAAGSCGGGAIRIVHEIGYSPFF